jgi:hypothetical protein
VFGPKIMLAKGLTLAQIMMVIRAIRAKGKARLMPVKLHAPKTIFLRNVTRLMMKTVTTTIRAVMRIPLNFLLISPPIQNKTV